MKEHKRLVPLAILILFVCLLPVKSVSCQTEDAQAPPAQIKRLILTDGSYEPISRYAIQGNRVRYFSAERHVWEELPASLVDWAATEAYARQAAKEASGRINEEFAKAAEERKEEDARFPLVAPDLRLPSPGEVLLLDIYQGKPQLSELAQSEAALNKNVKNNVLRGILNPVASSKQNVELNGLHARIQSHALTPIIYIPVDPADAEPGFDAEAAKDRFRIVRCENRKGNRIVAVYSIAVYGKVRQQAQYIEVQIEPVSKYWVRLSPAAPLKPGEYAFVELDNKGAMNLYVRDFGVNPDAPQNPVIAPDNPERSAPVLIQKPQKKANP